MATSDWQHQFILRSAEVAVSALLGVLDEVNVALASLGFSCLMLDYWNSPGSFCDYTIGRQELERRVTDCQSGSAFGEAAELRWRKIGNVFRLLLITEASGCYLPLRGTSVFWQQEDGEVSRVLRAKDRVERSLQLWGSKRLDNGDWVEARIPRPLNYPSMEEESGEYDHARLFFIEYRDERGRVVIHRRTRLTAHLTSHQNDQGTEHEGGESGGQTTA